MSDAILAESDSKSSSPTDRKEKNERRHVYTEDATI